MCGFLVTNIHLNIASINENLVRRGPDFVGLSSIDGINFCHTLLSITGELTPQPYVGQDSITVLNGEIYSFHQKVTSGDSEAKLLGKAIMADPDHFFSDLDGEFAYVTYSLKEKKLYFGGDLFMTKPIYFGLSEKGFGICSYSSPLQSLGLTTIRLRPNTIYTFDIVNGKIESKLGYRWDLRPTKNSFDFWLEAFIKSVAKRTVVFKNKSSLVPLSSGYDSGAVMCVLDNFVTNGPFNVFCFLQNENLSVLKERLQYGTGKSVFVKRNLVDEELIEVKSKINSQTEDFWYGQNCLDKQTDGKQDSGAIGMYYMLEKMKSIRNIKVQISGQGGDEIMSNLQSYRFGQPNPRFFSKRLNESFPYANFYDGANSSYLNKEEVVAGSLGIETRYPFLDKAVVQEYLSLRSDLKNKNYKAPLHELFELTNYPYCQEKRGFNPTL